MRRGMFLSWVGVSLVVFLGWAGAARAAEFVQVGVHPDAINQASSLGRTLQTLKPFAGQLYAGYGDYSANTGPIGVRAFDPVTGTFGGQLLNSSTEALYLFRQIGERLYAPHTDPRQSLGGYARSGPGGVGAWTDENRFEITHSYDIATLTGTDLYVVGSLGTGANVWRSTDGGNTYTVSLANVRPMQDTGTDFARIYFICAYQNKLYVQASDYYGGHHPTSRVFDGASWTTGPDLLPNGGYGYHPEVFAGKMVYESYQGTGSFYSFDGTTAVKLTLPYYVTPGGGGGAGGTPSVSSYDFAIYGNWLYLLNSQREVFVTNNLTEWYYLATAPAGNCLALLNDTLYVAGSEARLFQYTGPILPERGRQNPDLNSDCVVDVLDLAELATNWLVEVPPVQVVSGNINGDGRIDLLDLAEIAAAWTGPDITAPSIPQGLTPGTVTDLTAELSWSAASDDFCLTGYKVYRDNTLVNLGPDTSFSDTGLAPSTSYSYQVTALDRAGNESAPSAALVITTLEPDHQPPTVPTLSGGTVTSTSAALSWSAASDDFGLGGYKLYRDGTLIQTLSTTSFTDTGLAPSTSYTYEVNAYDRVGNESARSVPVVLTTLAPDIQPPTAPTLTRGTVTSNSVALSWSAASDDFGLAGYKLYRNNNLLQTLSATSYTNTGLAANTSYSYEVSAYDLAGNESARSNLVVGTTLPAANLLPSAANPGFETQSPVGEAYNWQDRGINMSRDATEAHGGAAALKVTTPANYTFTWGLKGTGIQAVLTPNASYRIAGWIKTAGVTGSGARVRAAVSSNQETPYVTGTSDWTFVYRDFTAPAAGADATGWRIDCDWANFTGGTAWFDDLSLTAN